MISHGYYVNINNYMPCENCAFGLKDKTTMLCTKPYYHHIQRAILKPKKFNITGVKPV